MLEVDDDDDVFEQADAEAFAERAEAAAAERQGSISSEPDDGLLQDEGPLSLEDFNLLPCVLNLLDAHQAGGGFDSELSALRRALSRCERGVASWAADASAPANGAASAAAEAAARASLIRDVDAATQPKNSPTQAGWVAGRKEQWSAYGASSRRALTDAP